MATKFSIEASKKWSNDEWKTFFQNRLQDMRSKRKDIEVIWDRADLQTQAESFYDNDGVLNVNVPLEKTLEEIYCGRTEGKVNFDIMPDGQADVEELQPTKYAMNFFLDGNEKDNFWKENKSFRGMKSNYWEWISFTGVRSYKDIRYKVKKDAEMNGEGDIFDENNFDEYIHETWFFFPQNIHPRDFYIDDAAYWQNDVQYAQDCIRKEKISPAEFELRYKGVKPFDQKEVEAILSGSGWVDLAPKNENDRSINQDELIIYHYYHRLTKRYILNVNETHNIFVGRYLYDDGKLPFECAQHYTRTDRFWGEGIPERVAWNKAYQSEIWQDILSGAQMNSGMNIVTWNDDQIGQWWNVGGRWINIWRSVGGVDNVKPVTTTIDLWYFVSVLDKLDQQSAIDSGINPREQFDPGSDKVGIVEIMEANKSVRNRSVDENYNIYLDAALTQMLSRIKQFAPSLLSEKIMSEDGKKVIKYIFPKITIKDYEVKNEKGKQVIEEAIGKYGYFDLKPWVIQWIWVKVVTPSTNSVLPILERQKVTEYLTNLQNLANTAAIDPTGEMLKKLASSVNFDEVLWWLNDAFGYDPNSLKANSEKDKLRIEILKKKEALIQALSLNTPTDANMALPPGENPSPVSSLQATGWEMWWPTPGQAGAWGWPANQGTALPNNEAQLWGLWA